ncbi:MAG: DUF1614 domain-containing protein [Thermodesulfobacteriota bacterium]
MPRPPFLYFPFLVLAVIIFAVGLAFFFALIQVGAISIAFAKLGLNPNQAILVLFAILFGSMVNIPVATRPRPRTPNSAPPPPGGLGFKTWPYWRLPQTHLQSPTQRIGLNLGGGLIPIVLSLYFLQGLGVTLPLVLCLAIVTGVTYKAARPIQGVGIGVPVLLPPVVTVLAVWLFTPIEQQPQTAYIAGTLGTLLGADLLHLFSPRTRPLLDAPFLSIGGAGTFDGIFLTGILAVLLT